MHDYIPSHSICAYCCFSCRKQYKACWEFHEASTSLQTLMPVMWVCDLMSRDVCSGKLCVLLEITLASCCILRNILYLLINYHVSNKWAILGRCCDVDFFGLHLGNSDMVQYNCHAFLAMCRLGGWNFGATPLIAHECFPQFILFWFQILLKHTFHFSPWLLFCSHYTLKCEFSCRCI